MNLNPTSFRTAWPLPAHPRPIVLIGAGGIVGDAHLPAYRKAALPVAGIFDVDPAKSKTLADKFAIRSVFESIAQAVAGAAEAHAVFDIAVPPEFEHDVLAQLPDKSVVLMQNPRGVDLPDAR